MGISIKVGSVWADKDPRERNRNRTVIVTGYDGQWVTATAGTSGRLVRINPE